ncbi:MAG: hypothetical protein ACLVL7_11635 [Anaerotruncus massiliensis (ex Togo et al. 2019)]
MRMERSPPSGRACPPTVRNLRRGGLPVFPGFIDAHTHLDMDNGVTATADDFATGTRAVFGVRRRSSTRRRGTRGTLARALERGTKGGWQSSCDYAFHMAITDWNPAVWRRSG